MNRAFSVGSVLVAFCVLFNLIPSATFANPAHAVLWPMHGAVMGTPSCPAAAIFPDDGCTGSAYDGNFQAPNFFTGSSNGYVSTSDMLTAASLGNAAYIGAGIARQTPGAKGNNSQPYAVTPSHDAAGVNFPVGYSQSKFGTGKDPAFIGSDPNAAGCTYKPPGTAGTATGGAQVYCNATGGITSTDIEGYDGGLHGCVSLLINNTYTGTVTVKNNRWINGPGCVTPLNGTGGIPGSPGGSYVIAGHGDAFNGYIAAGSTTLCVVGSATQGQVEAANNSAFVLTGTNIPSGTYITGAGGSCTTGVAYTLNQAPASAVGSSGSPVSITEKSTKFNVTSVNSGGIIGLNQFIQNDNNGVWDYGDNIVGCPGGVCGGTGAYTLNAVGYVASQGYVTGNSVPWLIEVVPGTTATVDIEQNYVDGKNLTFPLGFQSEGLIYAGSTTTSIYKYNAILHIQARPFWSSAVHTIIDYNYIEDFETNPFPFHGEANVIGVGAINAGLSISEEFINNTILIPADTICCWGTSPIWPVNIQDGYQVSGTIALTAKYNTTVSNLNQFNGLSTMDVASFEIGESTTYSPAIVDHNYIDGTGTNPPVGYCIRAFTVGNPGGVASNSWLNANYSMTSGHIQTSWNQACN